MGLKIKYTVKENTKTGTHSFFALPVFNGKLSFEELCNEACEDNTSDIDEMKGCVGRFMKAVQREVARGFRCELGTNFLTIYPNITVSVKDYTDKKTGQLVVATADMVTARNAKSRLGCTVNPKFSDQFAKTVTWQKIDANGDEIEEDDITEGNDNVNNDTPTPSGVVDPDEGNS